MQPVRADRLQLGQFIWSDVLPLVFGEGVQKYRTALGLTGNDHAITARSSLPFSSNALLDQAATQIRIDEPTPGALNRLAKARISNLLTAGKSCQPPGFEDAHVVP